MFVETMEEKRDLGGGGGGGGGGKEKLKLV